MADKNKDLEIIKKKYGENMMHLCRSLFPTLLEKEEVLSKILMSKFNEDRSLYDAIVNNNKHNDFRNYIFSFFYAEKDNLSIITKTPTELLGEAGYNLYKCETEKEIQSFIKYYAKDEELCTFDDKKRLDNNHVFWAVKKNVDEIKRENFKNPERQDEYGTSVISIQFARGEVNTLSIKNRYNLKVKNPDATFGNNLDNIIEGLSASFVKEFGYNLFSNSSDFELSNFVSADGGKLYRYNHVINNIYYCPNNIIIHNGRITTLDSSKQLLIDYIVVNLTGENKGLELHDNKIMDSFIDGLNRAQDITVTCQGDEKKVVITLETGTVTIRLNKDNQITGLDYPQLKHAGDSFLYSNKTLKTLSAPQLTDTGDYFLFYNKVLQAVSLPQLTKAGDAFLYHNETLENLSAPQLTDAGNNFLNSNKAFKYLNPGQIRAMSAKQIAAETTNTEKPHRLYRASATFTGIKNAEKPKV